MDTTDVERLRAIKTFPSLVKYLRDELDWPIESDNFEDLTFDYEPEELGLDAKTAVKIKEIKQLRPLASNQPWGIFFVNFEPKRLPVVVLRRILRSLVIKKRQSANKPQQAAWQLHDLLFISAYGESDHRDITLANFSEGGDKGDLPTLKVLGWDDEDTVRHLAYSHDILKEKLHWPANPADFANWRHTWSQAFTLKHREVIGTSKQMAERMAQLATAIRKRVNNVLAVESEKGPMRNLMTAFREALIHDLKEDDFADMYAQTITYGLLSARVSRPAGLVADNIRDMVPITNPFLRDLLSTFLTVGGRKGKVDFDELGINDVVQALRDANMEAVIRDFDDKNPHEDPVIHFYELFLREYDPKKRMQRGVFFTPRPVVSFIVRSVDEILRKEFGLVDGLADTTTWAEMKKRNPKIEIPKGAKPEDPFVQILDPACGTGTFLVEVVDVIHRTMEAKWRKQGHMALEHQNLWDEYVSDHLLPRLYGFELMMAPYAIAHMKIGLKLDGTGYRFGSHERARIYLTNSLEPPQDFSDRFEFDAPALAHEAQAVNAIKRHRRFTVVIGNPPYSVSTQNRGTWAISLIASYKEGLNEKKHTLDDDYVKFVALSQWHVSQSGVGVWGFITNHGYLKNPTFRGMRNSLLQTFSMVRLYDLHGNLRQKEQQETLAVDENVFDIQQGVVISLAARSTKATNQADAFFAELWGARPEKYHVLSESSLAQTSWNTLCPCQPFFLFVPQDRVMREEYVSFSSLAEVFISYGSGIKTDRDDLCLDSHKSNLAARMKLLFSGKYDNEFAERYNVHPSSSYDVAEIASHSQFSDADITQCLYRPFDVRWLYYKRGFTSRPAYDVIRHMLAGGNIGLLSARTNKSGKMDHFFCTRLPTEVKVAESTTQSCLFPLFLAHDTGGLCLGKHQAVNFSQTFVRDLAVKLSTPPEGPDGLPQGFAPEDIFNYAYAVFYSPNYRHRYAEFLKIDFPRLPLTSSLELFRALAKLGGELVALHLMESPKLEKYITKYAGKGDSEVAAGYPKYTAETVRINATKGFEGVPESVWNFHIGGYQVSEKWLKDRRGRVLSEEDITHYQKIVVALKETIRLMADIDKVIEAHGGWPGAFVKNSKE
jgi:predicted helicase